MPATGAIYLVPPASGGAVGAIYTGGSAPPPPPPPPTPITGGYTSMLKTFNNNLALQRQHAPIDAAGRIVLDDNDPWLNPTNLARGPECLEGMCGLHHRINCTDSKGWTATMRAAQHNCLEAIKWLIRKGESPRTTASGNWEGCTALHIAAARGHVDAVKVLADANNDSLDAQNMLLMRATPWEKTPLELAQAMNHTAVAEVLKRAAKARVDLRRSSQLRERAGSRAGAGVGPRAGVVGVADNVYASVGPATVRPMQMESAALYVRAEPMKVESSGLYETMVDSRARAQPAVGAVGAIYMGGSAPPPPRARSNSNNHYGPRIGVGSARAGHVAGMDISTSYASAPVATAVPPIPRSPRPNSVHNNTSSNAPRRAPTTSSV